MILATTIILTIIVLMINRGNNHTLFICQFILTWMPSGYLTSKATMIPNPTKVKFVGISKPIDSILSRRYSIPQRASYGRAREWDNSKVIILNRLTGHLWIARWVSSKDGILIRMTKRRIKSKKFWRQNIGKYWVEGLWSMMKGVPIMTILSKIFNLACIF